ncbi:MAG: hypothetical protein SGJ00_07090 [bacterium]|nr:hypothetical protein [bacterium]
MLAQNKIKGNQYNFEKELKLNPMYAGLGIIQFQLEKQLQKPNSLNVYVQYVNLGYGGNLVGFGFGIGHRSYFTPDKHKSFYIEPSLGYLFMEDRVFYNTYSTPNLAFVLGRKWIILNRFSVETFLGPSLNIGFVKSGSQSSEKIKEWYGPINGNFFRLGFTLGYRFN